MGKIVLLAVAAAWAAVLLPPLMRSRMDNRPGSSVTDFRRQLSTLQRTVPTRTMVPMRPMGRSFAPSPLQKPAVTNHRGLQPASRSHGAPVGYDRDLAYTGELERRTSRAAASHGQRQPVQRISRRELVRRRRTNVLVFLAMATAATLFLAATTKSQSMVYAFALAFVSLCGYCYQLAQLRQYEQDDAYSDANWFHAA